MLRLLLRADELAVRALKVAFDRVVLEVVDGLGLVLVVVVAAAPQRQPAPPLPPGRSARPTAQPRAILPRMSKTDDECFFMIRFSFVLQGGPAAGFQTTKSTAGSVTKSDDI